MRFRGRVWKFGDHVNTDLIIPARYINSTDPAFLATHCMEDADPGFAGKVRPGDIIVAGENFGCGSSREHAPIALRAAGIACVVAGSFARIFYRNAFNMGLPIFESKALFDRVADGEEIEVDGDEGKIVPAASGGDPIRVQPIPPFMQELIEDGGLMKHIAKGGRKPA
ncbi:MAG: 2,3-dimethylmalate dehydratase small subunit [Syntrophaceae bacterium PtaB.Bin095]|nr:MAG: 2,3-dimethylmalate dehydratase small subunit [Syntrophaceae bacterium PtaB.Bin095]